MSKYLEMAERLEDLGQDDGPYAELFDAADLLWEAAELEAALRRPEFHREFANDNGVCAPGCPACAALGKREDSRE